MQNRESKWKSPEWRRQYQQEYYKENRERILARNKVYRDAHKEEWVAYYKEYMNRPEAKEADSRRHKEWYQRNAIRINRKHRQREEFIRGLVLSYYGGGKVACLNCGEDRVDCLSLDHINDDGATHRRQIGKTGGLAFYWWLKTQGLPSGLQTLCANCQIVKERTRRRKESKFYDLKDRSCQEEGGEG